MNKAQAKIARVMVIFLSVISAFYGIARTVQNVTWDDFVLFSDFSPLFFFTLAIPILLICGLAILRARDKR